MIPDSRPAVTHAHRKDTFQCVITANYIQGSVNDLDASPVNGGGIMIHYAEGPTVIDQCSITSNHISGHNHYELAGFCFGGGISATSSDIIITDSTISDNTVIGGDSDDYSYCYAGIAEGGGIYITGISSLQITDSTISGNLVQAGYGYHVIAGAAYAKGGGIAFVDSAQQLVMINTTISGNTAIRGESSISLGNAYGAGVYLGSTYEYEDSVNAKGTIQLTHCTIAGNTLITGEGGGGTGLYGTYTMNNSIIADDFLGGIYSEDYNLIVYPDGQSIQGDVSHNIYYQDPLLGPLQDNGGPTWTHALQDWSPAIDAGSCVISGQTTDQRGVARPHDDPSVTDIADGCDIGAFEWEEISASIKGHVYLQDQTDHSGTVVSVLYENVPTMTGMGLMLLLIILSLLIWRYHGPARSMYVLIVLFVIVVGVQAALSVITPSDGSYSLSPDEGGPFPAGQYNIVFEHEGYYTQSIPITIPAQETVFVMDDVTLLPIGGNAGSVYATDEIVGSLRYIPAGTCNQGSLGEEACRSSDETLFNHILTRHIAVMETELTRQMWADLLAVQQSLPADPTDTAHGSELTNPVQNLTWFEAILYANLLSVQNGLNRCYYTDSGLSIPIDATNYMSGPFYCDFGANGYRLLSEGEWEYVTRTGTTGPFSCDESNYTADNCSSCVSGTHPGLEQYAVYCANDVDQSETVGSKLANPWNVHDLHGNVGEWCWDWSGDYPGDTTDYTGPASGSARVFRGGSWSTPASDCRSAARHSSGPNTRDYTVGVRLARSLSSGPLILNVTDPNMCTQSGISIAFSGAAGATRHDLWVDGVESLIDVTSPCAYDPQDSLEHTYVIRAFIGSESFDTASVSFTDNPVVPVITGIIDEDACAASGIRVSYNASSLAMRHDLYDESGLLAGSYVSDSLYLPGDTVSHDYFIRTIYQGCYFDSDIMSGTDSNDQPGEPALDPPSDPDPCAFGLTIVFTGGAGGSSHDLWVDGVQAMTGISSPFTYQSSDTASHEFMIRAVYGTCFKDSNVETASDTNNDP